MTRVKGVCRKTEDVGVRLGVHLGSALSHYLIALVRYIRNVSEVPWCLIFADDLVLVGESPEKVNERLKE